MIHKRQLTPKEAGDELGLSERTVRRYCASGRCPGAEFHPFPGTDKRGIYLLTDRSMEWLRTNVPAISKESAHSKN